MMCAGLSFVHSKIAQNTCGDSQGHSRLDMKLMYVVTHWRLRLVRNRVAACCISSSCRLAHPHWAQYGCVLSFSLRLVSDVCKRLGH
eukprot:5190218-Amphidinium_carterae.1